MAAEPEDHKQKVTLKEIEELYDRLGISRGTDGPQCSFEEYAWKYGLRPQDKQARTTRDTHTYQRE